MLPTRCQPITGILSDISGGEFKFDSDVVNCCMGMLEINKPFKGIDVVITTMQEWSYDSWVSAKERDELILNLHNAIGTCI